MWEGPLRRYCIAGAFRGAFKSALAYATAIAKVAIERMRVAPEMRKTKRNLPGHSPSDRAIAIAIKIGVGGWESSPGTLLLTLVEERK